MYTVINGVVIVLITVMLTLGYWVTPLLFGQLEPVLAGALAAKLFSASALLVLGMLTVVILWGVWKNGIFITKSMWPLGLSIFLMTGLYGWVSPAMQSIKLRYPNGVDKLSVDWPMFASLHGVYQVLYLLVIVLMCFWLIKNLLKPLKTL
ncbi:DUF4149 domain-containing protein [Thiomicrorhabdus aquaedulcis]|uniref:DUF4149 domain-containing protein n=1 Tax=Thiomicrorhabdus aquaedulcis TaxID=2211106 RepID=UPI000FD6F53E|nr:DUF4149 domain-containing protein [Thiomicrorhabdus aquaedulcis]